MTWLLVAAILIGEAQAFWWFSKYRKAKRRNVNLLAELIDLRVLTNRQDVALKRAAEDVERLRSGETSAPCRWH